ncbi:NACHT domain- and WD repeat-containing protein 1 [Biomphalaria glabrata]|nr:domain- and WD repeat-containing protein 1-like isoform X1 [Biomphalaria glabrata]
MALVPSAVNAWGNAPDLDIRKAKLQLENELLKLQAVRTNEVQLNPILLSNRLERVRPHASLHYSRVQPPLKEVDKNKTKVWSDESIALRQLSHTTRRGPRDVILPNLVKHPVQVKLCPVPLTDTMFHERRAAAIERLNQLLADWAVYHRIAHPVPLSRQSLLSDLDPKRKISRSTFIHIARGSAHRKESMGSQLSSSSGKKTTSYAVPKSLKKRNRWKFFSQEASNHLRASRMQLPEEISKSELRIYVSSTPDLQEEREFLEEVAYPKIHEMCEHMGLNCHMVDMRTGAGVLTNDIETFDLIEKELRTCRTQSIGPSFISLIGHELEDKKLPGFLYKSVFEEIREVLIKENVIGVEALDDVYRLDSNRVPPVYIKQRIKSVEEYQSPEEVERILQEALVTAVSIIKQYKPKEEMSQMDTYKWSAVVKEVEEGLLTNHSPRTDTLCLLMDPDVMDEGPGIEPIHRLRHNIVTHYRQYASRDNLVHLKSAKKNMTYLRYISDTFIASVTSLLKSQARLHGYDLMQQLTESSEVLQHVRLFLDAQDVDIESQLDTMAIDTSVDMPNHKQSIVMAASEKEVHEMGNLVETDLNNHTERQLNDRQSSFSENHKSVLEDICRVIDRPDSSPKTLLLWGQRGNGKTTLAAQVAKLSARGQGRPERKVVVRRLGATLRSSSLFRVLESLILQLNFLYSLNLVLSIDITLQEMVSIFCQTLKDVSAKQPTDGSLLLILDQLETCGQLTPHILASILDAISDGTTLMLVLNMPSPLFDVIRSHHTSTSFSRPYLSFADFDRFLISSLAKVNRVVTSDQHAAGTNALPADTTPICAQTIFHIVRWWPSHTLPNLKNFLGEPDLDFDVFLQTLESQLGVAFTRYSISLLASARHGLADQELLHLLSKDAELLSEIKNEEDEIISVVEGFPYQLQLSRIMARLDRFVLRVKVEGETVNILSTKELAKAVTARYMNGEFFHSIHQKLANFFLFIRRGLLLSSRDIVEKKHKHLSKYHWRTMRCVPYHLTHSYSDPSETWKNLKEKVFFNFNWLVNEVYSGFFPELLDDMKYALDTVSLDPGILSLQQLLLSVRHTVIYNPVSLAAFFSSLETTEQDGDTEFIDAVIRDARLWLQQVHLQTLVPVSYTPGKGNRLLLKDKCLFGVTNIQIIPGSEHLLVQRLNTLAVLNTLTGEEAVLGALSSQILDYKVLTDIDVVVLTSGDLNKCTLEMFNLQNCKHVASFSLGDCPVHWFHAANTRAAYVAINEGVRSVDLQSGKLKTVLGPNISWKALCVTGSSNEKLVFVNDAGVLEMVAVKGLSESKTVSLKKEEPNKHCEPLMATKDGNYVIYLTERQATVMKCLNLKVVNSYSHHELPIEKAVLSRSHEHLFLAYASGDVTCHVLYSGKMVMETKVKAKVKSHHRADTSRRHGRSGKSSRLQRNNTDTESITVLVTSEDDHFLFCGTNLGQVYVIHVPTGLHVVNISTRQKELTQMTFLTDRTHFQHLITTDKAEVSKHWNLRPLFKQARVQLQSFISDEDLKKEEDNKIELNNYIHIYQDNVTNRIFLNGPDITAFYARPPPTLFDHLHVLDPDFGQQTDWEISGSLADVTEAIKVMTSGHQLSDILLTMSDDFRLGRWSLYDGTLVWSKTLGGEGSDLKDLVSVYYDQAVLIVDSSRIGSGLSLSVLYTGEGQNKMITRDNVTHYWLSSDRTHILMLCHMPGRSSALLTTDIKLYAWDLINSIETRHSFMTQPNITDDTTSFVFVSPELTQCVTVTLPANTQQLNGSACIFRSLKQSKDPARSPKNDYSSSYSSLDSFESFTEVNETKGSQPNDVLIVSSKDGHLKLQVPKSDIPEPFHFNELCQIFWTRVAHQDTLSGSVSSGRIHSSLAKNIHSDLESKNRLSVDTNNEAASSEMSFPVRVTSLCFVGEENILIGTASGHVCLINLPFLKHVCVLNKTGPKSIEKLSEKILVDFMTPHRQWVKSVRTSEDMNTLISQDCNTVCVWNARNKNLVMNIELGSQEKISNLVVSKDAAIIVLVADYQILHLYTPLEKREIANYKTTFDITSLYMTCDCRKILIRGTDSGMKPVLEIFEVRNVDDILMHIAGRKVSQQNEVRESLTNERTRRASHVVKTDKS